jgi:MoxR-like ATPase
VVPPVRHYIVEIAASTRFASADIQAGASPRAGIALALAAQAYAASSGRAFVSPDDVKAVACPVLRHRLVLSRSAADRRVDADSVISSLLGRIAVPTVSAAGRGT